MSLCFCISFLALDALIRLAYEYLLENFAIHVIMFKNIWACNSSSNHNSNNNSSNNN